MQDATDFDLLVDISFPYLYQINQAKLWHATKRSMLIIHFTWAKQLQKTEDNCSYRFDLQPLGTTTWWSSPFVWNLATKIGSTLRPQISVGATELCWAMQLSQNGTVFDIFIYASYIQGGCRSWMDVYCLCGYFPSLTIL